MVDYTVNLSDQTINVAVTLGSGITAFTDMTDTPSTYVGQANKFVKVNAGATGLEFATSSAAVAWGSITGTLSDQTDLQSALDAGVSDGDKGDITVSGTGTIWTIDSGVVTFAKMQDVATNSILGRSTAGTGDIEELADSSARTIMGLATSDSPQFTAINVGHATDTTLARTSAGRINVEGTEVILSGDNVSSLTNDSGFISNISGENIEDLGNVTITTPADNEVLAYNSGTSTWINQTASEAGLAAAVHTHATSDVISGTFDDARIAQSNVTQHQAALSITESQISDLGSYITSSSTNVLTNKTIDADATGNVITNIGSSEVKSELITGLTEDTSPDGANDYVMTYDNSATALKKVKLNNLRQDEVFEFALSDETTDLTTGTAKLTWRVPFACTLNDVRASVTTAPTGANLNLDINEGGVSVLSTILSIDATEKTSTTAATPVVISDSALADDAEITFDIDQVGSTVAGAGLKVKLYVTRT